MDNEWQKETKLSLHVLIEYHKHITPMEYSNTFLKYINAGYIVWWKGLR